jgi:uncharacterized membrane protein
MRPSQIESLLAESLKNDKVPAHRTIDLIAICTELCSSDLVRDRLQDAYSLSLMTLGGKESIEAIFLNIDFKDPDEILNDINSSDYHEDYIIPDGEFVICLQVLRTVRNFCLEPSYFDSEGAVVLSTAHAKLKDLFEFSRKMEQSVNNFKQAVPMTGELDDGGQESDEAKMKYRNEF